MVGVSRDWVCLDSDREYTSVGVGPQLILRVPFRFKKGAGGWFLGMCTASGKRLELGVGMWVGGVDGAVVGWRVFTGFFMTCALEVCLPFEAYGVRGTFSRERLGEARVCVRFR